MPHWPDSTVSYSGGDEGSQLTDFERTNERHTSGQKMRQTDGHKSEELSKGVARNQLLYHLATE